MIRIVSKPNCSACEQIKQASKEKGIDFIEENMMSSSKERRIELLGIAREKGQASMPIIFVDDEFIFTHDFEKEYLK